LSTFAALSAVFVAFATRKVVWVWHTWSKLTFVFLIEPFLSTEYNNSLKEKQFKKVKFSEEKMLRHCQAHNLDKSKAERRFMLTLWEREREREDKKVLFHEWKVGTEILLEMVLCEVWNAPLLSHSHSQTHTHTHTHTYIHTHSNRLCSRYLLLYLLVSFSDVVCVWMCVWDKERYCEPVCSIYADKESEILQIESKTWKMFLRGLPRAWKLDFHQAMKIMPRRRTYTHYYLFYCTTI